MIRSCRFLPGAAAGLTLGASALGLAPGARAQPDRVLRIAVAPDEEFRQTPEWKSRALGAVQTAGETLESDFGIRVEVGRLDPWLSHEDDYDLAALHDELMAKVAPGECDLVVGFVGDRADAQPRRLLKLGHSDTPGPYLVVTDRAGRDLALVLLHEIGHAFGLPHVKVPSVMNEEVHPDRTGFDSVCAAILRNNRNMDFGSRDPFAGCPLPALQALYDELAARGDDVADLLVALGDSYRRRGELDPAESAYRKASDLNPGLLNPKLGLGMIAMQRRRLSEAILQFEAARREAPETPGLDMNLGLAYAGLGQSASAMTAYRRALDVDPGDLQAMNNLGLLHMEMDDLEAAEDLFLDALDADPDFVEALNNIGILYRRTGRLDLASEAFKDALFLKESAMAHRNLASVYLSQGRRPEALKHLRASLDLDPGQAGAPELRRLIEELR